MRLNSFVTQQHKLTLPDDVREKAKDRWVRTQQARRHQDIDEAPFARLVDFWIMSIAFAVHRGLPPSEKANGTSFVSIGPNKNDLQNFREHWAKLLTLIAVDKWGYDDEKCNSPAEVIKLANQYADAGARPLLNALESVDDMASAKLYVLADVLLDETAKTRKAFENASF